MWPPPLPLPQVIRAKCRKDIPEVLPKVSHKAPQRPGIPPKSTGKPPQLLKTDPSRPKDNLPPRLHKAERQPCRAECRVA